jgi:flagellar motor switch protein FliM
MTTEHLSEISLQLRVRFLPAPIQIRDVASLRVGDVLFLGRKTADQVEVRVGGRPAFLGHPGAVEGSMGVQISHAARPVD